MNNSILSQLKTQPISDNKWPNKYYPTYCSGGAYIVNKPALEVLGKNMTKFPYIMINDAFIGCVMQMSKFNDVVEIFYRT